MDDLLTLIYYNEIAAFVVINIDYIILAKLIWGKEVDKLAIAILVIYYLVFLNDLIACLMLGYDDFIYGISGTISYLFI